MGLHSELRPHIRLDVLLIAVLWLHGTVSILGHFGRQRQFDPGLRDEYPSSSPRRRSRQSELVAELNTERFPVAALAWFRATEWGGQDSDTKNVSTRSVQWNAWLQCNGPGEDDAKIELCISIRNLRRDQLGRCIWSLHFIIIAKYAHTNSAMCIFERPSIVVDDDDDDDRGENGHLIYKLRWRWQCHEDEKRVAVDGGDGSMADNGELHLLPSPPPCGVVDQQH